LPSKAYDNLPSRFSGVGEAMKPDDGRRRVVIQNVQPQIEAGRYPVKRTVGETVRVQADIFADGQEAISARLLHRWDESSESWTRLPMQPLGNDRWQADFLVTEMGTYEFSLEAWVDDFVSWQLDLAKRVDAGQDVKINLKVGAGLVAEAAARAGSEDAQQLERWAASLESGRKTARRIELALSDELRDEVGRFPDLSHATRYHRTLQVTVDRMRAGYGAWYELFPRSASNDPKRHGTFADVRARLPELADMGFDVLYLPPIHPIGTTHRKGPNNRTETDPDDLGSPWAIGSPEGGHMAIHPKLGTLDDFRDLVAAAERNGMEIALDLAFQCSPDHPYVQKHPEWFRARPDGTIQYAENPPKKYEDIYPFDFETEAWKSLWNELKRVVLFWVDQGVNIFRVDNPHTKPFAFWDWLIAEVKAKHPNVLFLAEAFTRPKVMYRLAKGGFTQSYTYFAWRNTAWELRAYLEELTGQPVVDYFRPNLWPNTPDILTAYLQNGGRPAFVTRFVLAATLGASYGIYGPAFEVMENRNFAPGSEEYLDSEKYQIRAWDIESAQPMRDFMTMVNQIRRENPALHSDRRLAFHDVDNPQLLCYSKATPDRSNVILVVVNTDPYHTQSGWISMKLDPLGVRQDETYQAHELLTDTRYAWQGDRAFVQLDPDVVSAHIFRIRHRVRTERDFEYYA
jgi:starch synthase (maltosyl-transferring)